MANQREREGQLLEFAFVTSRRLLALSQYRQTENRDQGNQQSIVLSFAVSLTFAETFWLEKQAGRGTRRRSTGGPRFHDGRRRRRVRHERIPDLDSIASHRYAAVVYFERERLSSSESFRETPCFLVGARTPCLEDTGNEIFSSSRYTFTFTSGSLLCCVVFSILRLVPVRLLHPALSLSFSFSFSSPSVYALPSPAARRLSYLRDSPCRVSVRRSLSGV